MVSASQDGKLLIWDTFTGNKVSSHIPQTGPHTAEKNETKMTSSKFMLHIVGLFIVQNASEMSIKGL